MPGYRTVLLLIALVGAGVGGCLVSQQQASSPPKQQQGTYVGSEVCVACHAALGENLRTTPHVRLLQQASPDPAVHWGVSPVMVLGKRTSPPVAVRGWEDC